MIIHVLMNYFLFLNCPPVLIRHPIPSPHGQPVDSLPYFSLLSTWIMDDPILPFMLIAQQGIGNNGLQLENIYVHIILKFDSQFVNGLLM